VCVRDTLGAEGLVHVARNGGFQWILTGTTC